MISRCAWRCCSSAYLPGALLFRLPVADRARRAGLGADERVFWHVMLSVAWSLARRARARRAGAYRFDRLLALNGVALRSLIVVGGRTRLALSRRRARGLRWTVVLPDRRSIVARPLAVLSRRRNTSSAARIPARTSTRASRSRSAARSSSDDPVVAAVPRRARDLFFPTIGLQPTTKPAVHGLLRAEHPTTARSSASSRTCFRRPSRSATASTA